MSAKIESISDRDYSGVVDAAMQITARRRELQIRIKRARMAGDVDLAFQLIDELVPDSVVNSHDKALHSIDSSKHVGPRRLR